MKELFAATFAAVLLTQAGCSDSGPTQFSSTGAYDNAAFIASIETYAKEELTEEMEEGLLFMREEEKVARDVYRALGNKWNLRVMNNIAQSEQRHMDAIKILLDRYNLDDPAGNNPEGVFTNQSLQQMYFDLVAQGSLSVNDALQVGKLIEETDINDLVTRQVGLSADSDILHVYQNLKLGSENHLDAFNRNLQNTP